MNLRMLLVMPAAALLVACGGDPTAAVCPEATVTAKTVNLQLGQPARVTWKVDGPILGFSVGAHPSWQEWSLVAGANEIVLWGAPTQVGTQQLSFKLTTACGEVTVSGGIINVAGAR